jgi:hypothetical protein
MGVVPNWWNALDPKAQRLINDTAVTVRDNPLSTGSDWWRYVTDHKADIGVAVGGVAITGVATVLTGGAALVPMGIAAGTKALASGVSSGWATWSRSAAQGRIDKARQSNAAGASITKNTVETRPCRVGPPPLPNQVARYENRPLQERNAAYKDTVLKDALTVFQNGGLQRLYDAFQNMREDFDRLRTQCFLVTNTSDAGNRAKIAASQVYQHVNEAQYAVVNLANPNAVTSCGTLSSLWEGIFRCSKRMGDVAAEGALLEEVVTYVTLMVSEYTDGSAAKIKQLWRQYFLTPWANIGDVLAWNGEATEVFNELRSATRDKDIQQQWGAQMAKAKDPGVWAFDAIVSYLQQIKTKDMPTAVPNTTFASLVKGVRDGVQDPTASARRVAAARALLDAGAAAGSEALQEYVASPLRFNDPNTVLALAAGLAQDIAANPHEFRTLAGAGSNVLWKVFEQFHNLANVDMTAFYLPSAWSIDWANLASGIGAGAETLMALAVKWAVDKGTLARLEDPSTPLAERVGLLKDLAAGSAADYVKTVDGLKDARDKLNSATSRKTAAAAILRYILTEGVVYANKTGQLLEIAGQVIAELRYLMAEFQKKAKDHTETRLRNHQNRRCNGQCYRDV